MILLISFKFVNKNFVMNNSGKKDDSDEENEPPKPSKSRPKTELKVNFRRLMDRADGKIGLEEFPLPEATVKEESTRSIAIAAVCLTQFKNQAVVDNIVAEIQIAVDNIVVVIRLNSVIPVVGNIAACEFVELCDHA